MNFVIFGLSVSSSWGNGHATLWRGLCEALARRGHKVTFFERDVPYYATHRDLTQLSLGNELILYPAWEDTVGIAESRLRDADVAMVTSYCADALPATDLALDSRAPIRAFYDLDSPATIDRIHRGERVEYIGPRGLGDFDLVLSYAGGTALAELETLLGARRVFPLYGSVDPAVHRPAAPDPRFRADLSYLGTYSTDRNQALEALFVEPARRLPNARFVLGGSQYDGSFPWQPNIFYMAHVPPALHPAFYCSARLNLNVTRRAMCRTGYCPSGRLFEAAACGATLISDRWEGIEEFFRPGEEILLADSTEEMMRAIERSSEELERIGRAAREAALSRHTADHRARELETILESAGRPRPQEAGVHAGEVI